MRGNKGILICRLPVFPLALLFLSGCSTLSEKPALLPKAPPAVSPVKAQESRKILDDVLVFLDLQEVDLDADGKKEIVAVYSAGENSSGVKVAKFDNGKGSIIFNRIFNNKNTKLEIKNGIPCIISEDYDSAGRKLKRSYLWDGTTFSLKEK
jgi:hypothetical protein